MVGRWHFATPRGLFDSGWQAATRGRAAASCHASGLHYFGCGTATRSRKQGVSAWDAQAAHMRMGRAGCTEYGAGLPSAHATRELDKVARAAAQTYTSSGTRRLDRRPSCKDTEGAWRLCCIQQVALCLSLVCALCVRASVHHVCASASSSAPASAEWCRLDAIVRARRRPQVSCWGKRFFKPVI